MEQGHKISRDISTSTQIGDRQFPARLDYEQYFIQKGIVTTPEEFWGNDDLIIAAQRHWHTAGQNGCVFAQTAATKSEAVGWQSLVSHDAEGAELQKQIQAAIEAIEQPGVENLSLLFPHITDPSDVARLVRSLPQVSDRFQIFERPYEDRVITAIRMRLNDDGVLSWVVGFGPFDFLPTTRQSPITELAIRTKPKPPEIFHRLSKDPMAAHLADVQLGVSDQVMERLWTATQAQTHELLEGQDRAFSSAKVTYAFPAEYWQTS
jgi:hypothetical protein